MKKYKTNDRVVVRGASQTGLRVIDDKETGCVLGDCSDGWYNVSIKGESGCYIFHAAQLRKLKPKAKINTSEMKLVLKKVEILFKDYADRDALYVRIPTNTAESIIKQIKEVLK